MLLIRVPPEMSELSVEEFMARIEEFDADMASRVERAQAKGCNLRCGRAGVWLVGWLVRIH